MGQTLGFQRLPYDDTHGIVDMKTAKNHEKELKNVWINFHVLAARNLNVNGL